MVKVSNELIDQLYREAFPAVARMVASRGGDLQMAKDIFQDALIIFLEKQSSDLQKISTSPAAYIAGIARILRIRSNQQQFRQDFANKMATPTGFDEYSPLEETAPPQLVAYLESAGQKCLELLQAFYYDNLSMNEIAGKFQYRSSRSATVQKYKCLEKVREAVRKSRVYEKIPA